MESLWWERLPNGSRHHRSFSGAGESADEAQLQPAEVFQNLGAGPVLRADELAPDGSVLIDHVGFRRAGSAEGEIGLVGGIEHD